MKHPNMFFFRKEKNEKKISYRSIENIICRRLASIFISSVTMAEAPFYFQISKHNSKAMSLGPSRKPRGCSNLISGGKIIQRTGAMAENVLLLYLLRWHFLVDQAFNMPLLQTWWCRKMWLREGSPSNSPQII